LAEGSGSGASKQSDDPDKLFKIEQPILVSAVQQGIQQLNEGEYATDVDVEAPSAKAHDDVLMQQLRGLLKEMARELGERELMVDLENRVLQKFQRERMLVAAPAWKRELVGILDEFESHTGVAQKDQHLSEENIQDSGIRYINPIQEDE
jgi:hypothetical protein